MIRVTIDEAGFRLLAAGRIVVAYEENQRVELILSPNIGWARLMRAVLDGIAPPTRPASADPPEAREFLPNRYTRRDE